ncbi:YidC/Oxa1 family membrane protein insertase [Peptoniphilus sp.]|jgi:YidC/Oxa1 family membrane protein insertase|uniref:YidC/Oxa1 family membrane protein insertase n=1 Tax=Peptoniphilus sp. TaxID=1971214 RepID=UPI003D8CCDA0
MSFISSILGSFVRLIYNILQGSMPEEPASISFFALSIIIATIIIKVLILPLNISQTKNQKKMAKLQPQIMELQRKYKNDPQTLAAKQQKLYKESDYKMSAGCLPMIITLVVLMAFYRVFLYPEQYIFTEPGVYATINKNFFHIIDLDLPDKSLVMPLVAAVTTFLVSFIASKNPASQNAGPGADQAQSMMKSMMVVMPIMIFMMGRNFAAGLVIYWTVSNLFAIVQQLITNKIVKDEVEEVNEK